jgi:hypothetical protein
VLARPLCGSTQKECNGNWVIDMRVAVGLEFSGKRLCLLDEISIAESAHSGFLHRRILPHEASNFRVRGLKPDDNVHAGLAFSLHAPPITVQPLRLTSPAKEASVFARRLGMVRDGWNSKAVLGRRCLANLEV